jgi:hypothetical protein
VATIQLAAITTGGFLEGQSQRRFHNTSTKKNVGELFAIHEKYLNAIAVLPVTSNLKHLN